MINSLKRKYGSTIEQIIEYKETVEKEINDIENSEELIGELKSELSKLEMQMYELSLKMNNVRQKYAEKLSKEISIQLNDLEMKNAEFCVNVEFD